ncbi:YoaK family protein [Streptomyces sp. NPDC051173]|uniref:YoaK family protein n=1 Tax=Streptomyces sp. NPDC051173 TaxID=3155164 RepID=UPI00344BE412
MPRSHEASLGGEALPAVILALTMVSGMVDAISFLGLGKVFTGMMTGNVIVLGFAFGGVPGYSDLAPLVAIAAFVTGIVLAGLGERLATRRGRQHWFCYALTAEAAFLAAATALAWLAPAPAPAARHTITALLALTMGTHCAAVRRLAVPDLVVTFGLTGALIGLVQDSGGLRHGSRQAARRLGVILALTAGAALGAALVEYAGLRWSLLCAAAMVATIAAAAQAVPSALKPSPGTAG